MKDHFKNFQDKVRQYVLCEFDNLRVIIIVVWDLKDPYAHVETYKPTNIIREDNEYIILVTQLQQEAKDYVKRVRVLKKNVPKIYDILWGQYNPCLKNEFQGETDYDTN